MADDPRLRVLARRLAIEERPPDERFVLRTGLALRARNLQLAEAKGRREQAFTEIAAVGALALAAHRLLPPGAETAAPLGPLLAGFGAMGAAWAVGALLLSRLKEPRRGLRPGAG